MTQERVETEPSFDWRAYEALPLTPILTAALERLQENGYHGTTVREVAHRVGLTMPALYYHYGNKEGILTALLEIAVDDVLKHIAGGVAEAGEDARARFVNVVTAVAMHMTHRRDLAKLHPEFRFLGPEARAAYVTKRARVEKALVSVLEDGVDEGLFNVDNTRSTARIILGMLAGIPEWYKAGRAATPDEVAADHVRAALRIAGDRSA